MTRAAKLRGGSRLCSGTSPGNKERLGHFIEHLVCGYEVEVAERPPCLELIAVRGKVADNGWLDEPALY